LIELILSIIGGLALFLYAVNSLSETINQVVGDRAKGWILRFTGNLFSSIVTGIFVTTILDSSSAVIILTIIMVNGKVLTFRQAMGIVMGANIGTTFSSQLIAMNIGKYSPVLLILGLLLIFISKSETISKSGKVILYFGILFFGLYTMERSVEPLRQSPVFESWLQQLNNPLYGTVVGMIVTILIQSSSATVGMIIVLAKKGAMTLAGGLAVMMGAELGTVSDTLIATFRGSRQAIKTGIFHLVFNLTSIILGLIVFYPFVALVEFISVGATLQRSIANGHMIFNLVGVLFFLPFIPLVEKALNKILPDPS
jgi:phosphate:Na+ symporter